MVPLHIVELRRFLLCTEDGGMLIRKRWSLSMLERKKKLPQHVLRYLAAADLLARLKFVAIKSNNVKQEEEDRLFRLIDGWARDC